MKKIALDALAKVYDPGFHESILQLLSQGKILCYLRTNVCLQIANVIPDQESADERTYQIWMVT